MNGESKVRADLPAVAPALVTAGRERETEREWEVEILFVFQF